VQHSDYDDGADDGFRPGTRKSKLSVEVRKDPGDPGFEVLRTMRRNNTVGSFLVRIEDRTGQVCWAQDGFVVVKSDASSGRGSVQSVSAQVRLVGLRRFDRVAAAGEAHVLFSVGPTLTESFEFAEAWDETIASLPSPTFPGVVDFNEAFDASWDGV
jgi:hypothetical protein